MSPFLPLMWPPAARGTVYASARKHGYNVETLGELIQVHLRSRLSQTEFVKERLTREVMFVYPSRVDRSAQSR